MQGVSSPRHFGLIRALSPHCGGAYPPMHCANPIGPMHRAPAMQSVSLPHGHRQRPSSMLHSAHPQVPCGILHGGA